MHQVYGNTRLLFTSLLNMEVFWLTIYLSKVDEIILKAEVFFSNSLFYLFLSWLGNFKKVFELFGSS